MCWLSWVKRDTPVGVTSTPFEIKVANFAGRRRCGNRMEEGLPAVAIAGAGVD